MKKGGKEIKNIHFMGIGGSGISGVSILAKKAGYSISGCNLGSETPYINKVRKEKIKVFEKHDEKHLEGIDLLVVTPAILFSNSNSLELIKAKKSCGVMTWQEFVGKYLINNKKLIAISGTHGKSTTTALLAEVIEAAGINFSAIVGAKLKKWDQNYKYSKADLFIIEADEFNDNFLFYHPEILVVNNIEFDHPDYFKNEQQFVNSFVKLTKNLKGKNKTLIINLDSPGVIEMYKKIKGKLKGVGVYGHTLDNTKVLNDKSIKVVYGLISRQDQKGSYFSAYSKQLAIDQKFFITIPGRYNVSNALNVVIVSQILGINEKYLSDVFKNFSGIGRRMDLVYDKKVKIYDDYAHHPTAIKKTLNALRQKYPTKNILTVVEPHSYSRSKALIEKYAQVFDSSDKVIIGPIFKARDSHKFGMSEKLIAKKSSHKNIRYAVNKKELIDLVKEDLKDYEVIVVMGAGESYLWTKEIVKLFK